VANPNSKAIASVQRHFALWKTFRGIAITIPGIVITLPANRNPLIAITPEQVIGIPRNH
jgi:hypothetical protein